jgi:MIP family channel proteins
MSGVLLREVNLHGGDMFNSKVFLAELIGTFALVFFGAGAGVANVGLLSVALAHGLTVTVFAYTYGYISGTHVNPAVTFGLALQGVVKWGEAVVSYWIPQFIGAFLAAFLLRAFVGDISGGATVGSLTTSAPILAMVVEALLTFFLVNTVLHTAVGGKGGQLTGLAIGLTLIVAILAGGPLTGASLNPARTFGTALFAGPSLSSVYTYVIYLFGPFIGAVLAVITYQFFNEPEVVPAVPIPTPVPNLKPADRKPTTRRKTKK